MNFGIHQNSSCPGLLPVQCDTEASEPRKRAATDDSPLVVADSPTRNEQVVRVETPGARHLHRDAAHDEDGVLGRLRQVKNLPELGLNDRDRVDLVHQHIVLGNPSHPVTREDRNDVVTAVNNLHLVRGEVYDPHFPPFKGERA